MRDKNWKADRRCTIRIRQLSLLRVNLDKIDRPGIKIAETLDELEQAFYMPPSPVGYKTPPYNLLVPMLLPCRYPEKQAEQWQRMLL